MILHECLGAWRRLVRRPGYAALSVSVLGVGLGVVVFLFSLVHTLVLEPLPFPQGDRLVAIGQVADNGIGSIDSDQYLRLQDGLGQLDGLGAYASSGVSVLGDGGAIYVNAAELSASLLDLLAVKPLLGRPLVAADQDASTGRVALLGESLWRRAFQADPHVVGRAVRIDGAWVTVVGVMPTSFGFPSEVELWMPLRLLPGEHRELSGVGRLRAPEGLAAARAELAARNDELRQLLPSAWHVQALTVKPLALSFVPEDMRRWVWLMFGAGSLVLLLACLNVANLQLVQSLQRSRELALRSALGSTRARLVLRALMEAALLSLAALAVALPIVLAGQRWIVSMYFENAPGSAHLHQFGIDGGVLAFALAMALACTALAGGIPAWRATGDDLQANLREGTRGSGGGFARFARVMVVAEVALTVVLLVGAGTFVRALDALLVQPPVGASHASQVLTAQVALPPGLYTSDEQRIQFFETLVERLRVEAGVTEATASNTVPSAVLGSHEYVALPGQPHPNTGWPRAQMGIVDGHFLSTYGVRLLAGRFIDARDRADTAAVVVIDRKMAQAFWPGAEAVGQSLVLYPGNAWARTVTVVGVIEPLQLDGMLERPLPGLLMPLAQSAKQSPLASVGVAIRTPIDAQVFARRLIGVVRSIDPQAAVHGTLSQARSMAKSRVGLAVLTQVFATLGLVALLLAAAGLYGVLAFSVAQRTREIGIRRAIGAGHAAILRDAGRQLAWQLGIGLSLGVLLALPWSGVLADPVLRTRAHDPAVFVPVAVLVILVSALAALQPLRRALRVDPAIALRDE
ncbi:ABC transporter permease [Dyella sp. C9]|uniref:ABC transporter permease n=1 Tax=Dyella sp. C9 TaxID=2202154 RepID=UPI000DF006E0|nr:ABC transporter permease [Dyella sp. C9]